jgi:hypothetical protein
VHAAQHDASEVWQRGAPATIAALAAARDRRAAITSHRAACIRARMNQSISIVAAERSRA